VYSALQYVCLAALVASAPVLLTLKFFRKQRIPWWVVVLSMVVLSTVLGIGLERIGPRAHFERFDACINVTPIDSPASQGAAVPIFPPSCGPMFYHVATPPIYLKWVPGLALLALSMPFYGLAIWLRSRRARFAAA
jgi:hypothetical protein